MFSEGTLLGPYQIQAAIGAGGMGEVYRAHDSRLGRTVAIKVLSKALTGQEHRDRFEREARAIARLDHPHICALHDIGRIDDTDFLVLEYLHGETLAQRLERGAMPVAETLRVALQIADALEAAHRQHIIHRDLKPSNVILTKSGVKLLDFGLAKAFALSADPQLTVAATAPPLTAKGTIVGTLHYMAPEQLEGRELDARTDIFAFGVVLYEMLTGRRAFSGTSQASIIAAILEHEPTPITQLQPHVTPLLDRIARGCMHKDPDRRWQSVRDVSTALRLVDELPSAAVANVAIKPTRGFAATAAVIAALGMIVGAAATFWLKPATPAIADARPLIRFDISAPATESPRLGMPSFGLSGDGSTLVHVGITQGVRRLYVRHLSDATSVAVPGTENATAVYVSPDGRAAVFPQGAQQSNLLKRVDFDGGAPVTIGDAGLGALRGLSWGADNSLVFSRGTDSGLWRLEQNSREPVAITRPDVAKGERSHRWPFLLPGGRAVLYTLATSEIATFDDAVIRVFDLQTKATKDLIHGGSFPVYAEGYLLYARGGAVLAAPFDVDRLEITGPSSTVLTNVVTYPGTGAAQFAVAASGTLVSMNGGATQQLSTLVRVDRTGRATPLAFQPAQYNNFSVAPQGTGIAIETDNANASISVGDINRGTARRLTLAWSNNTPVWTPDGKRVGFTSGRGGDQNIFWQEIDGRESEQLTTDPNDQASPSFSPDGRFLTFLHRVVGATNRDIYVMDLANGRKVSPLIESPFDEATPRISPDGHWLAYDSNESGTREIYVQSFPDMKSKRLVSESGGTLPVWSKSTKELFYRRGEAVMAVTLPSIGTAPFSAPTLLFKRSARPSYDTTSEGDFVMVEDLDGGVITLPLQVTVNWVASLAHRK
jgi:eukaryotic-like serine/threonine-protein kinase